MTKLEAKILSHPAVVSIRDEGDHEWIPDSRGRYREAKNLWVELRPGWTYEDCIEIHGLSLTDVWDQLKRVKP
jgi:hypothetical protein